MAGLGRRPKKEMARRTGLSRTRSRQPGWRTDDRERYGWLRAGMARLSIWRRQLAQRPAKARRMVRKIFSAAFDEGDDAERVKRRIEDLGLWIELCALSLDPR